ncbi:MAG: MoaD/ThiS family protein [Deltaproteobacteria bacterium]|nr:MoaD/ThiS family protein [Deltaproteobacteria bacterium]
MKITIRYFAQLKDRFGKESDVLEFQRLPQVADIFTRLFPEESEREKMQSFLRVAVNEEYASKEALLHEGDEVVFIPPVAGG